MSADSCVVAVRISLLRELGAMRRTIAAYPDDASVWATNGGMPNSSGTLALHCAGNIQHFVGRMLGGTPYVRDRDAEFARRDVPRAELDAGLAAASVAVEQALSDERLAQLDVEAAYPQPFADRHISTGTMLVHLAAHLAYHLGQMDAHRRAVTGAHDGVGAMGMTELPSVAG